MAYASLMGIEIRSRLLDEAWGGAVFTLAGEEMAEAFPGGFEEAAHWCAQNGMTIAASGDDGWTLERTPLAE